MSNRFKHAVIDDVTSRNIDATEVVMMLAPETNGHVACKAWC